jgi:hypothetical protein
MKEAFRTDELSARSSREPGFERAAELSHVFIMDVPTYHKVLIVTDAAINIAPTLEEKADIIRASISPYNSASASEVAILAAVETINSKTTATIDAAALCKMADRGQIFSMVTGVRQRDLQKAATTKRFIRRWPASRSARHRIWRRKRSGCGVSGQGRQRRCRPRRSRADHPRAAPTACGADRELRRGRAAHARRRSVPVAAT